MDQGGIKTFLDRQDLKNMPPMEKYMLPQFKSINQERKDTGS